MCSYTDSPNWIKQKKATINLKNKMFPICNNCCIKWWKIESHPGRVSSIKPLINKYKWSGINNRSKIDDWKTFEKNNPTIALNILYIKEKQIWTSYNSKINSNCEKQMILLMIPNKEKKGWSCSKKIICILHEITSKLKGDFYCLKYLKNKLKSREKVHKNNGKM